MKAWCFGIPRATGFSARFSALGCFQRAPGERDRHYTFGKAFPKSVQITLVESGWRIDEAWTARIRGI